MKRNILLTIEYDGTYFAGWQRQPGQRTAQGMVEEALSDLLGEKITIDGTSRTDAGVHALGQRATFAGDFGIPTDRIKKALNDMLARNESYRGQSGPIIITEVREMPEGFHARFDSLGKKYRYIIDTKDEVNVFERNYTYHLGQKLDTGKMNEALEYIRGTHDFAAFQAAGGTPRETTVRTIYGAKVFEIGDKVIFEVSGDGFLYNMVRIMVGTLIQVGLGKIKPEEVKDILDGKDRQKAGPTAPAEGLYLVEIYYTQEEIWTE